MTSTAVKLLTVLRPKGSYLSTILGTSPIALWPLSETSGTTAVDVVGGRNGTYTGITVNNAPFPDGTGAPRFTAGSSYISLPDLSAIFNTDAGTMLAWHKVSSAAQWTNGATGFVFTVGADANNRVFISKNSGNNGYYGSHRVTGTSRTPAYTQTTTAWFMATLTWNKAASTVFIYDNATPGSNAGAPGNWVGALSSSFTAIGNYTPGAVAGGWDGYIKYMALWNRELTPTEVASLYVSSFAV